MECHNRHIQRIVSRKNADEPSELFNMYNVKNTLILQTIQYTNSDLVFAEAVKDFREKLEILSGRTNVLHLNATVYERLIDIKIDDSNREQLSNLHEQYEELMNTNAAAKNNEILSRHPLHRFYTITVLLRKWLSNFIKDVNRTKSREEFYAKMQLNAIKDSVGYMVLLYYYFDALKFYPTMTFNMARYKVDFYKRVEREMPYLKIYKEY